MEEERSILLVFDRKADVQLVDAVDDAGAVLAAQRLEQFQLDRVDYLLALPRRVVQRDCDAGLGLQPLQANQALEISSRTTLT
jgi:hypothetical protein